MPIDPNAVNAIANLQLQPGNAFRNAQTIRNLKQNELLGRAQTDLVGTQTAGAELRNEAGQLGLDTERTNQSARRLAFLADTVARSKAPRALAQNLLESPEMQQLGEDLGIDFTQIGPLVEADDDGIRNTAGEIRDAAEGFLTSGRGRGAVGRKVITTPDGRVVGVVDDNGQMRGVGITDPQTGLPLEEREPFKTVTTPAGVFGIQRPGGQPQATPLIGEEQLTGAAEQLAGRTAGATRRAQQAGLDLTPGEAAVDAAFAKEFADWRGAGGFSTIQKNLDQLQEVQSRLQSGQNLTGPGIGVQPRAILALTNPSALDTMEQVEEVVQRNLRLVLGAQFTEKEGVRLIERAYNPRLDEKLNAKRVGRLIRQIGGAAQAKEEASQYWDQHGTLKGFRGKTTFSIADFDPLKDEPNPAASGQIQREGQLQFAAPRIVNPQTGEVRVLRDNQWVPE